MAGEREGATPTNCPSHLLNKSTRPSAWCRGGVIRHWLAASAGVEKPAEKIPQESRVLQYCGGINGKPDDNRKATMADARRAIEASADFTRGGTPPVPDHDASERERAERIKAEQRRLILRAKAHGKLGGRLPYDLFPKNAMQAADGVIYPFDPVIQRIQPDFAEFLREHPDRIHNRSVRSQMRAAQAIFEIRMSWSFPDRLPLPQTPNCVRRRIVSQSLA